MNGEIAILFLSSLEFQFRHINYEESVIEFRWKWVQNAE